VCPLDQGIQRDIEIAIGDRTTALAPPPLDRVAPRAVSGHIPPHLSPRCGADDGLDFSIDEGVA